MPVLTVTHPCISHVRFLSLSPSQKLCMADKARGGCTLWVGHFSPQPALAVSQPHFFKAAAQGLVHLLQFPFQQQGCEEAVSLLLWRLEKAVKTPAAVWCRQAGPGAECSICPRASSVASPGPCLRAVPVCAISVHQPAALGGASVFQTLAVLLLLRAWAVLCGVHLLTFTRFLVLACLPLFSDGEEPHVKMVLKPFMIGWAQPPVAMQVKENREAEP